MNNREVDGERTMEPSDPAFAVIDALEKSLVPYMLVGSHSSNFYGIPRSTRDADFVIELGNRSIVEIEPFLPATYHLSRQVEFETLTGSLKNVIRVEGTRYLVELFRLTSDPYHESRFSRRRKVPMHGREVWIPTAEDVIIQKMRWGRSKDVDDARDVLSIQGSALDWNYIHHWCDIHNTRQLLDELRRSLPRLD